MQNTPRVITVASSKGGVGKSTICISLAGCLAHRGQNVHIIDLDANCTAQRWFKQHRIALPNLSVEQVNPSDLLAHLKEVCAHKSPPDYILIDVAGLYEKALLHAMARSNLVIVPAQPSEPDLHEAMKIIRDLAELNENFSGQIPYRLLLNMVEPLDPQYQRYTIGEVTRLGLSRFETLMHKRAAYRETFLNGQTPHQAAEGRVAAQKARAEIDAIVEEIEALLQTASAVKEAA